MGAFEDRLAEGYARQGRMTDQTPEARLAAALGAVEEILAEYGLRTYDRDGIHRWRCEYPDRYGPCECFADMMQAIRDAVFAADPTLAADLALAAAAKEWYEQTQSLEAVRSGATPTSDFIAIIKAAKEASE